MASMTSGRMTPTARTKPAVSVDAGKATKMAKPPLQKAKSAPSGASITPVKGPGGFGPNALASDYAMATPSQGSPKGSSKARAMAKGRKSGY